MTKGTVIAISTTMTLISMCVTACWLGYQYKEYKLVRCEIAASIAAPHVAETLMKDLYGKGK